MEERSPIVTRYDPLKRGEFLSPLSLSSSTSNSNSLAHRKSVLLLTFSWLAEAEAKWSRQKRQDLDRESFRGKESSAAAGVAKRRFPSGNPAWQQTVVVAVHRLLLLRIDDNGLTFDIWHPPPTIHAKNERASEGARAPPSSHDGKHHPPPTQE